MMPVKIMFLVDQYEGPHAGTEGQLLLLLQHLDRARYEPSVALLRSTPYIEENGLPCPVTVLGITKLASLRAIATVLQFALGLRRDNYKIVHCVFNDSSIIAPIFLKLLGIRVLVSRRDMGFWYTKWNLAALRLVARFIDRYITNSRAVARHVADSEWVPSRKITVIYNGYAPDIEHSIAQQDAPGIDSFSDHVPLVGIVANLRPIKRIDVLVRAFAMLKVSHPTARLVIVGDCSSPQARSTRECLELLADRLEILDRIIFTGRVADPSRYVRRFSIAVLCSESEGFSNSLVEYMRYRRAIVCTDTGGNSEIIRDGHNGFLVPVGDASILAERLAKLLSDTALAQRFGHNAHAAVQSYSHVKMVSRQMQSYTEILQNLG